MLRVLGPADWYKSGYNPTRLPVFLDDFWQRRTVGPSAPGDWKREDRSVRALPREFGAPLCAAKADLRDYPPTHGTTGTAQADPDWSPEKREDRTPEPQ